MHESDRQADQSSVRDVVDEVHALPGQVGEALREVVDLVGDVMHAGTTLGEEPADWRVSSQRAEQLDAALTEPHRNRLDALRLERVAPLDLAAEEPPVRVDRLVEVLDRDAEMVNPLRPHAKRMLSAAGGGSVRGFRALKRN